MEGEGKGKGKGKDEGKGKGENCCGNSNLDFHPKFLPPKIVFFILYISFNFTIRTSWTWRGLKTIHLPFLRESVRCTVCSSPNVTYLKDYRHIFVRLRIVDVRRLHEKVVCFLTLLRITSPTQGPTSPYKQSFSVQRMIEDY